MARENNNNPVPAKDTKTVQRRGHPLTDVVVVGSTTRRQILVFSMNVANPGKTSYSSRAIDGLPCQVWNRFNPTIQ